MTPIAQYLQELFIETLKTPRTAARRILDMPATPGQAWSAFGAMICVYVILISVSQLVIEMTPQEAAFVLQISPFQAAAILAGLFLSLLLAGVLIGRMFGGVATFLDGLRLASWLLAVRTAFQAVILVFLVLLPTLGGLLGIVSFGIMLWLTVAFTTEAHRFDGAGTAVFTIILAFTLTCFVLIALISMLGIGVIPETPNV